MYQTAGGTARKGGGKHEATEKETLRHRRGACGGGIFRGGDVYLVLFSEGASFRGRRAAHHHRYFFAEMLERSDT